MYKKLFCYIAILRVGLVGQLLGLLQVLLLFCCVHTYMHSVIKKFECYRSDQMLCRDRLCYVIAIVVCASFCLQPSLPRSFLTDTTAVTTTCSRFLPNWIIHIITLFFQTFICYIKSILLFLLACDSLSRCYVKCNTRYCFIILKTSMLTWHCFHIIMGKKSFILYPQILITEQKKVGYIPWL